jgi:hypothetical protein
MSTSFREWLSQDLPPGIRETVLTGVVEVFEQLGDWVIMNELLSTFRGQGSMRDTYACVDKPYAQILKQSGYISVQPENRPSACIRADQRDALPIRYQSLFMSFFSRHEGVLGYVRGFIFHAPGYTVPMITVTAPGMAPGSFGCVKYRHSNAGFTGWVPYPHWWSYV